MERQMRDVLAGRARWAVECGDARSVLAGMADACVDAVVTDPPYALTSGKNSTKGFMGAAWDCGQVAHDPAFWAQVLRVTKPGAFLLAFGGTRTYHRLACAVEDAGWECRDMLNWLQGSGFPKSKSCLKPSHEPILLAKAPGPLQPLQIDACRVATAMAGEDPRGQGRPKGAEGCFPFSDDAWGNGHLKHTESHPGGRWPPNTLLSHHPDCQPAGVRRVRVAYSQPMERTTSASTQQCRRTKHDRPVGYADADGNEQVDAWTCVDGCPVAELDRQAGPRTGMTRAVLRRGATTGTSIGGHGVYGTSAPQEAPAGYDDGATNVSRFFPTFAPDPEDAVPFRYEPKASRSERDRGLDALPLVRGGTEQYDSRWKEGTGDLRQPMTRNGHPTVKPTALMAWLCKLVTPEDGVVLDCFGGSGSTAVAALRCGMRAIIIEQDAHYCDIARARIAHAEEEQSGPLFAGLAAQR